MFAKSHLLQLANVSATTFIREIKMLTMQPACPFTWNDWKNRKVVPGPWAEFVAVQLGLQLHQND